MGHLLLCGVMLAELGMTPQLLGEAMCSAHMILCNFSSCHRCELGLILHGQPQEATMSAWASWDPNSPHHHLLLTTVPLMKAIECLSLELGLGAHPRMPRWGTHQVGEESHSLPPLCLEELWDINDVAVREAQLPL